MPGTTMAVVIVAIVFGFLYAAYELHVKSKSKTVDNELTNLLKQEIAELKERISVLEKIVTDEKYNLKKEIDDL